MTITAAFIVLGAIALLALAYQIGRLHGVNEMSEGLRKIYPPKP